MSGRSLVPALLALAAVLPTAGCAALDPAGPRCGSVSRLALVAQSVPGAAYVPCVDELPTGWRVTRFEAERGRTAISLLSDRADGRAVDVVLAESCARAGATPVPPRTTGGRTYLRLHGIAGSYAGDMYDVFPGGCVSYAFDFTRGPHIGLMEDLFAAVELMPRRQLRISLRDELGVELGR